MISANEIRQRTVIDAAGVAIGDVETVVMDPVSWHVDALRVRLRREMTEQVGATKSLFRKVTIDVPTTAVQSVGDAVLLHVTAAELREASPPEETGAPATH